MMSIEKELDKSKGYLLNFVEKKYFDEKKVKKYFGNERIEIPKLTIDNVARVEAMIQTDSRYSKNGNEDIRGTSACWFKELRDKLNSSEENDEIYKSCITEIVNALDKENSTRLNAVNNEMRGLGRSAIADAISKFQKVEFINNLIKPNIALQKDGLFSTIENRQTGGKTNTSFASKFCHYACFYLFDDENRDNYSIYDAVIRSALPIYIKLYKKEINNIWKKKDEDNPIYKIIHEEQYQVINTKSYEVYQEVIDLVRDAVRDASGENISRNGFDHLLWYYFKGKNEEEIEAIYDCLKNDNN